MTAPLLSRSNRPSNRSRPELTFLGDLPLALARVHEFCGNARRTLAMIIAGQLQGPVFWIVPGWLPERPHPDGMVAFAHPGRFTFITPRRPEDLLWVMEEVLRSGGVPLVVADIPGPPGLTQVRRLHLAAETGAAEGKVRPLGLLLTPGDGGAQGVESRWHMAGAHSPEARGWALSRRRARTAPQKDWHVCTEGNTFRLRAPLSTS